MRSVLKQLFSLVLPITVLVLVPMAIEKSPAILIDAIFFSGLVLIIVGICVIAVTVSMFIRIGQGTLAPWNPTQKLVTSGPYAYMRNPMITGVLVVLLGEMLAAHSSRLFIWLVVFFIINHLYFLVSEEPGLVKRFGGEYLEYKKNVPRWLPRWKPWRPNDKNGNT